MPSIRFEEGLKSIDAEAFSPFISSLPPETMGSGIYGITPYDFSKMSMENVHKLSRISYGKILSKWGGANLDIEAFGDFTTALKSFSPGQFMEAWEAIKSGDPLAIADEVLDVVGTTWETVGTVGDMGEAVPIVGIFIQLAHLFIDGAKSIRRSVKEVNYPIEDVVMEYTKANDEFMAGRAIDQLLEKDWSIIFSPPKFTAFGGHSDARSAAVAHSNVKWKSKGGQGVILTMQGGDEIPGIGKGFGFHPQTSRIPIAWQYYTGDPEKRKVRKGWTYKKGLKNRVDSFEETHPATQQLSVLLWQRLLKNTPEIYRVDANGIRGAWSNYFRSMEEYLTRKADEWGTGKTGEFVRPMTRGVIERILSPEYWGNENAVKVTSVTETEDGWLIRWSVLGKDVPLSYYTDPKKLVRTGIGGSWADYHWVGAKKDGIDGKEIGTGKKWGYGVPGPRLTARGLTEYLIDTSLKARQMDYLDTLTVAYLTPDMPAFRKWPELLDKFNKNQAILLTHEARILVDLDRVPESAWKNKLKESLKGIPPGKKYSLLGAKIKAAGGDIVLGEKKKEVGNMLPLISQSARMPGESKGGGGGGGGGIAIAAVAVLGLVVMSGKKK